MTVSFDFTGRTAVVTGAAQGIGRAIAELFAAAGAKVAVLDRDEEALKAGWGHGTGAVILIGVDISDAHAVARAVRDVSDWAGGIDVAVNNAGITRDAVVWKLTDEQWAQVLGVHLAGTFYLTREVIPVMRAAGYGRIINVTSYTGLHGNVSQANYAAAKAGIIGFTKTVAKEVARFGITVNAISPNAATAMVAAVPPAKLAELTAAIPAGWFADPAEIAPAVAFLATEQAGYIAGTVLAVDGGLSM